MTLEEDLRGLSRIEVPAGHRDPWDLADRFANRHRRGRRRLLACAFAVTLIAGVGAALGFHPPEITDGEYRNGTWTVRTRLSTFRCCSCK